MKILITGASGFIGRAAVERFGHDERYQVVAASRRKQENPVAGVTYVETGDIDQATAWAETLNGIELVIHTAAHVHVRGKEDAEARFQAVNVGGTLNLARQALGAGVKRFLFLSSIKVNGESTAPGRPFLPDDVPAPADAYGRSKHEAEIGLKELSQDSDMAWVVIRPPLVYGPGVKANFLALMRWIYNGWPVPLGSAKNRRSLVAIDNLIDLIATCAVNPAAANEVFTVSDDDDVSTSELVRRIGVALHKPAKIAPVPGALMRAGAALLGKHRAVEPLVSSLQVDISKTGRVLGWSPVTDMQTALNKTARHFMEAMR